MDKFLQIYLNSLRTGLQLIQIFTALQPMDQ